MSLNPQQLSRMGIVLDRAATDLRQTIRAAGGFQLQGGRLTHYAQQIKQFARRLEQTQRSIDGARGSRMPIQARHRIASHQGALDTVAKKALKVALLLEEIMFVPSAHTHGTLLAQGGPGGDGPSKLNKRSLTDIAMKLQKLMSQGQSQLSSAALHDLSGAQAKFTAAHGPGASGDLLSPILMTIAIGLEMFRMWGMARGRITRYHE